MCPSLWFPLIMSLQHSLVVVNVFTPLHCRPQKLSPQFSMVYSWRATLRSCGMIFSLNTVRHEASFVSRSIQVPGFNGRPQRFLLDSTVPSFTDSSHVAVRQRYYCLCVGAWDEDLKLVNHNFSSYKGLVGYCCSAIIQPLTLSFSHELRHNYYITLLSTDL